MRLGFDVATGILWLLSAVFLADAAWTLLASTEFFQEIFASFRTGTLTMDKLTGFAETLKEDMLYGITATPAENAKAGFFQTPPREVFAHLMVGQLLLMLWLAWVGAIGLTMCTISEPLLSRNNGDDLKQLFRHLKHTFLIFFSAVFLLEMIHPDFGFKEAQTTTTLLTFTIPAWHVSLGMCVMNAMMCSTDVFLFGLPVAAGISSVAVYYSRAGGPGSFFIVMLHVFTKILQFFGTYLDDRTTVESHNKAFRPRRFTMFGKEVLSINDEDVSDDGGGGGGGAGASHGVTSIEEGDSEEEPDDADDSEDSDGSLDDSPAKSLAPEKKRKKKRKKKKKERKGEKENSEGAESADDSSTSTPRGPVLPKETKAELLKSAEKEEKQKQKNGKVLSFKVKNLFSSLARFGSGFAIIMALSLGFVAMTSQVQEEAQWYPDLINISQDEKDESVSIGHAYVAKLRLETKGEPVIEVRRNGKEIGGRGREKEKEKKKKKKANIANVCARLAFPGALQSQSWLISCYRPTLKVLSCRLDKLALTHA